MGEVVPEGVISYVRWEGGVGIHWTEWWGCDGEVVVIAGSSTALYAVASEGCVVPKPKGDENSQWRA